jgi:hydrogenase expression/formation protein HypD
MKYLDEFRDPRLARLLLDRIARTATRPWVLMEICGGQTHTLMRYGIDELLPAQVELVHGPGCPVCVTPLEAIEKAIEIAARPEVIFVCYGDVLRLFHAKQVRGDLRIAYSPMDALKIARAHPERQVVFFGIGFETTSAPNAMAVYQARREGLCNFSMLVSQVLVPPAMRLLLAAPDNRVQGLIAPGHVCTITGFREYEDLGIPVVVAGFEPADLLEAILMLVVQLEQGRADVENQYARAVTRDGNPQARRILAEVFEVTDRKWRGMGLIPKSGLRLREEFRAFDAEHVFGLAAGGSCEPAECIGARVLQGLAKPPDCTAFGTRCTPETPLGAPMVSNEGACAAYYLYRRHA